MRTAILYDWSMTGMSITGRLVVQKDFDDAATQAYVRQLANDMAREHDIKHGHVAIMDGCMCVDKVSVGELLPTALPTVAR